MPVLTLSTFFTNEIPIR